MNIVVRKTGKSPVYRMGKINYIPEDWQKVIKITNKNIDKPLDEKNKFKIHWSGSKLMGMPYIFTALEKQKIINLETKTRIRGNGNDLLAEILIDDKSFDDLKEKVLVIKQEIQDNYDNIKYKYLFSEEIL